MELLTRIITRNDSTAKWLENADQVLLKGEMAIEFTESGDPKIKIGDGTTTYANLKYFGGETTVQLFETDLGEGETHTTAIERVVADTEVTEGAFAVVKTAIAAGKTEYTAYIYTSGVWKALDGNYNAENVYFDKDLVTTSAIGNITLTNGQATIAAQGKNLKQLFDTIFVKEKNPTITAPSVSISSAQAKAYEVGTKVTPSWIATFNTGKYEFGPNTGVTVNSWTVTDTEGHTVETKDGSFPEITVTDDTAYKITATADHTDGVIPVTNVGNTYESGQIKAGTKSATTNTSITGYRSFFYGVLDTTTADAPLTSSIVRALTNGGAYNGTKTFTLNGSTTAKRIIIAIPANSSRGGLKEVILTSAMNTPVTDSYIKTANAVEVEGVNGATAITYNVWCYEPAAIDAGEVHKITLA